MKKGFLSGYDVETGEESATQKMRSENPMNELHYIGFDVHKKTTSYCIKTAGGELVEEGTIPAQRNGLREWASARTAWRGAMEVTLFSAWTYRR